MMKKVLIAVFIVAVLEGVFAKTKECNTLLNCKECADESHCETCPDGYYLDTKRVCRIDCQAKFGRGCPYCSATRCICPSKTQEWNAGKGICEEKRDCTSSDPSICTYCGVGYDLLDMSGKCSTCSAVFGEGCLNCTYSHCTGVADGYKLVGAVAVPSNEEPSKDKCVDYVPGCWSCQDFACKTCSGGLKLDKGFCSYKLPNCGTELKPLNIKGTITCGTCESFDPNCGGSCSGRSCTMCKTGFALTSNGFCVNCSSSFPGCGICQEDACTKCRSSSWILTPNGCFNQNPYVPPEESNGGMIAGIVIGAIVVLAIVILAVYCIVVAAMKRNDIDPSLYEDDLEFKSVSSL